MNDHLKQKIRAAIGQAAGQGRIIRPQVTAIQAAHGEALLARVLSGAPVRTAGAQMDWYNPAWAYRLLVNVDGTKVPSAQTRFPVYLAAANVPAAFWAHCNVDGSDIRAVAADDGVTLLPLDLPHFDRAGQQMELHALLDLNATPTNTPFYLYYGNPGAAALTTAQKNAVWAADYAAVFHLGEATGNFSANTGHGFTGARHVDPGGKVGKLFPTGGETFDGTNDWIDTSDGLDLSAGVTGAGATVSCWAKQASIGAVRQLLHLTFAGGASKLSWFLSATDKLQATLRGASTDTARTPATNSGLTDTADWHLLMMAVDIAHDAVAFYVDGSPWAYTGTVGWTATAFSSEAGDATSAIGSSYAGAGSYFAGLLDEFRIRYAVLSADYAAAQWANQNVPATFYSVGAEQLFPGI